MGLFLCHCVGQRVDVSSGGTMHDQVCVSLVSGCLHDVTLCTCSINVRSS